MLAFSKDWRKSERYCISYFKGRGWKVEIGDSSPNDLKVEKGLLKFYVEIVDKSVVEFRGLNRILALMEEHARLAAGPIGLIHLANFDLSASLSSLEQRGIVLLRLEDVKLVTDLEFVLTNEVVDLDARQIMMLERNTWVCARLAERFFREGNHEEALLWLARATALPHPISPVHHFAFNLLMRLKETNKAKALVEDALARKKDDQFFLQAALKFAVQEGEAEQVTLLTKKLADTQGVGRAGIEERLRPRQVILPSIDQEKKEKSSFGRSLIKRFWQGSRIFLKQMPKDIRHDG